jgi:hypothetical protein
MPERPAGGRFRSLSFPPSPSSLVARFLNLPAHRTCAFHTLCEIDLEGALQPLLRLGTKICRIASEKSFVSREQFLVGFIT